MVTKRRHQEAPSRIGSHLLVLRYRDHAGQKDQEHQGCPLPDIGNHHGDKRQVRIRQPGDRDRLRGEKRQEIVDRSAGLEQHEEHVSGNRRYDHHRHEDGRIEKPLAGKIVDEKDSQTETQQELQRHANDHHDTRAPECTPEARVVDQIDIVEQADPQLVSPPPADAIKRRPVGERNVELHQDREQGDEQHQDLRAAASTTVPAAKAPYRLMRQSQLSRSEGRMSPRCSSFQRSERQAAHEMLLDRDPHDHRRDRRDQAKRRLGAIELPRHR